MIIISNIISFILISYIANSFLTLKYSKNKSIIILLLSTTIVCLTNYNGASPLKSIILLAIYFIYVFVQYNGRIIQKVMTIIPYFLIQILSEILVAFCLNIYKNNSRYFLSWIYIWNIFFICYFNTFCFYLC